MSPEVKAECLVRQTTSALFEASRGPSLFHNSEGRQWLLRQLERYDEAGKSGPTGPSLMITSGSVRISAPNCSSTTSSGKLDR